MNEVLITNLSTLSVLTALNDPENKGKPIHFRLSESCLGMTEALAIYDLMETAMKQGVVFKMDVLGAMDLGTLLVLLKVEPDNRYISDYLTTRLNRPMGFTYGSAEEITIAGEAHQRMVDIFLNLIADNSDFSREELDSWCADGKHLTADELRMGVE